MDKILVPPDIIVSVNNVKTIMEKNATWKTDISNLLDEYNREYIVINTWCIDNGLMHKNKFADLWSFYNYWRDKNNKLDSYASRRKYISSLYEDFSSGLILSKDKVLGFDLDIHPRIYSHIKKLFEDGHYANAVEEAYKVTRQKLVSITGKEKGHEAFKEENYEIVFGKLPQTEAERNFCEGVKFLHLAIQNFRNEKAHTPAKELDKNKAIHYIFLASLAFYLIDNE